MKAELVLQKINYRTPVGNLRIQATESGISAIGFYEDEILGTEEIQQAGFFLSECVRQLDEYFLGNRKVFSIPFDLQGTGFQKKVWMELLNIPFGKTISYLELARRLGDEKVIRAAGSANAKNPIAILIPCHRVIGSNGELVGYAGGLHRKQWLLEWESGAQQTKLF